jgi:hypothetical protein
VVVIGVIQFILGIGASFLAWLAVTGLMRPQFVWETIIRAGAPLAATTIVGPKRYRVKLGNYRHRAAINVSVTGRIWWKGLNPDYPDSWAAADIPMTQHTVPLFSAAKWGKSVQTDLFPKKLTREFTKPRRKIYVCRLTQLNVDHLPRFPSDIADSIRNGDATMERLLSVGLDSYIRFHCIATDGFSGVTSLFSSKKLRSEHIHPDIEDQPDRESIEVDTEQLGDE